MIGEHKNTTAGTASSNKSRLFWNSNTKNTKKDIMNEQEKEGKKPVVQYCDSTTAISSTINTGADHKKMKHVEVRYHYVRTLAHHVTLMVADVHTDLNVADILTKSTKIATFIRHCKTIMEGDHKFAGAEVRQ